MEELPKEIVKSVKITVTYESNKGRGANDFSNLQALKVWLDKHPVFAESLGYVKKK